MKRWYCCAEFLVFSFLVDARRRGEHAVPLLVSEPAQLKDQPRPLRPQPTLVATTRQEGLRRLTAITCRARRS